MQLIPAIDLRHGEVVRLEQGDDGRRRRYGLDPLQVLTDFAAAGVRRVHVVDLDAAFGEPSQRRLIAELGSRAAELRVPIELGGGLRHRDDLLWAFGEAGIERVVLGSMVARDFSRFATLVEEFPGRVLPALEVAAGELRIAGWREAAKVSLEELCRRLRGLPCPAALVTDVERDGTLAGPNLELTRRVGELSGLPVLLSGGVHQLGDLRAAAASGDIVGAIVGKALYDGVFTVREALVACGEEAS